MGTVVLDTSVVIAFVDPADAHHQTATRAIQDRHEAGDTFLLPASVLAEVLVGQIRLDPNSLARRCSDMTGMFGPARPVDEAVAVQAALLRATHHALRLPDALVVATGIVDEADAVLTADKRLLAVDDRVRLLQ